MNIFNVALCIRAFLFFSYPSTMTGDSVWVSTNSILGIGNNLPDSFTAATPLGELAQHTPITYSISDMIVGFIPGSIGETVLLQLQLVLLYYCGQVSQVGKQCLVFSLEVL